MDFRKKYIKRTQYIGIKCQFFLIAGRAKGWVVGRGASGERGLRCGREIFFQKQCVSRAPGRQRASQEDFSVPGTSCSTPTPEPPRLLSWPKLLCFPSFLPSPSSTRVHVCVNVYTFSRGWLGPTSLVSH